MQARHSQHHHALSALDFLFALFVHACVIIVLAVLVWWHDTQQQEPLKRITINMISAKELAALQHRTPTPAKEPPHKKAKPPTKTNTPIKPIEKTKLTPKPKPTLKKVLVSKPAKKNRVAEETFDPFAPVSSPSSVSTQQQNKRKATQQEIVSLLNQQLSDKEMDRYIAMMQAAVQQHWRVPASNSANTSDPLVELQLSTNGQIQSVKILESSGNSALDASLITAIQAAAPFTLPAMQHQLFKINRIRFHPLK